MRILTIVHGFPPAALGGTEIYVHDLVRTLGRRHADEIVVLTREADPARPEYAVRRERRDGIEIVWINNTFCACGSFEDGYRHPPIARIGGEVMDRFRPEVAHIQHLTCLSTELVSELASRAIPVVFTLNDYWLICHRGQLLDLDDRRCDGPYAGGCGRCIGDTISLPGAAWVAPVWRAIERCPDPAGAFARRLRGRVAGALATDAAGRAESARRLDHMRSLIPLVTRFQAPSRTLYEAFRRFGIPEERMVHREQGIDQRGLHALARVPGDRLRLGFLGSLMVSKAPHLLLEAAAGLPDGSVSVQLFGAVQAYHGDDRYRAALEPWLTRPFVHHAGPIAHGEVPRALAGMDALVVPSIWIENAPFVIREAFAAGVPVVASNLGGMAELVEPERNGLLFAPGDAEDLRRALRRLLDEPGLLDRLRAGVPRMRTIEEDADWTRHLYVECLPWPRRAVEPRPRLSTPAGRRLAAVLLNYGTPEETLVAARSLLASARPIDDVIIVDNGSDDDSVARLSGWLPGVTILPTGANLGFAGGSNAGIRQALARGADLVALVNSDTVVPPDTLACLEDALDADPARGIVAPVILSRPEPDRVASAGMVFSTRTGRMRHLAAGAPLGGLRLDPAADRDGVSACAMLVRREVFERVGLFDEDYFFSFEDLDLCLRARAAGFSTAVVATAVVYHEGGRSIGRRSPRRVYFATRNHLRLAASAGRPSRWRRAVRGLSVSAFNLAYVLTSPDVPRLAGLAAFGRGIADHLRGRYGPDPRA